MKLNINFLQTGGVPLTNDLMADIMSAVEIYDVLGALAGHCTIISGCEVTGNFVAPGVVAINGEVLSFAGGTADANVYIDTEDWYKTFEDQTDKILIQKKTVRFGIAVAPNLYPWADFVRLDSLKQMKAKLDATVSQQDFNNLVQRIEILEKKTAPIINGGVVFPWRKPANEIPAGWKECTDFRGKVIVGQDPNDVDFASLGGEIGEKKHQLTEAELPKHSHKIPLFANGSASGNAIGHPDNYIDWKRTVNSWEAGGNQPHNNIQPSRIAMYIEPNFN